MPDLHFHEEDWERVERDTIAWWNGELDRPLVYFAVVNPYEIARAGRLPAPFYTYQSNYPLETPVDQLVDGYEAYLSAAHFYADSFPWLWANFGPGIMAGFLGARVTSVVEPSETVWFNPAHPTTIHDLELAYKPDNIWWRRAQAYTCALIERFGRILQVGHTDLGGNLDVLASLLDTEQLLVDLVEQPEEVERQARRATSLWLRYYDELDALIRPACRGTSCWTPLWSPGRTYMLQSDFSYMISPRMFERFVLPDLATICDHLDHAFYHLDGKGEIAHLDMLLSIERLRGIQWIPGDGQPPSNKWPSLLKRIRDGGKLCQVFVRPEGALEVVRELGGKGFLLVIETYGPEFYNPEVVKGFLKELSSLAG